MKTVVINLMGGPASGKSTLAAEVYFLLKSRGINCELVREYVKDWAWANRKVTAYDQPLICANQINREALLYGKVDYIVTDSPIIMSPFYQQYYMGHEYVGGMVKGHLASAAAHDISHRYFLLDRRKAYSTAGRYETESQARDIDGKLKEFLDLWGLQYEQLQCKTEERASFVLSHI